METGSVAVQCFLHNHRRNGDNQIIEHTKVIDGSGSGRQYSSSICRAENVVGKLSKELTPRISQPPQSIPCVLQVDRADRRRSPDGLVEYV